MYYSTQSNFLIKMLNLVQKISILDGRSYLETGFLALQMYIDRMIILHIKSRTNTPEAANIDFSKNSKCTCEVSLI